MIITKKSPAAPDVPARPRRDAGAAAARRHGAGARLALRRRDSRHRRRLGVVYVPNGIMMDKWTPAAERPAASSSRRSSSRSRRFAIT